MKKIILSTIISLVLATPAFAGEEIQLAAAIGAGGTQEPTTGSESTPGSETPTTGGGGAVGGGAGGTAAAAGMSTATMVTLGVLGAGALAAFSGGDSTSNH